MAPGRERRVPAPERRLRRLLRLPLRLRHVHASGATRTSSPRSSTARPARSGSRTCRSTSASCTPQRGGELEDGRGGHDPGAVPARRQVVRPTPSDFIRRMADERPAVVPATTAPAAPTSTTTRTSASSARRRPSTRTRTRSSSSTTSSAGSSRCSRRPASSRTRSSSSRPTTGPQMETWPDAAYTPFRCAKGSTWEGGVRVPGIVGVARDDRRRPGRATACSRFTDLLPTMLAPGRRDGPHARRPLHRRRRPDLVPARRPTAVSNRKYDYYWLLSHVLGACACGEYKFMLASTSDDDTDVAGPGRVHRRDPEVHLRPALQPLPGPEGAAQLPDPQARLHRGVPRRASASTSAATGTYPPKKII